MMPSVPRVLGGERRALLWSSRVGSEAGAGSAKGRRRVRTGPHRVREGITVRLYGNEISAITEFDSGKSVTYVLDDGILLLKLDPPEAVDGPDRILTITIN